MIVVLGVCCRKLVRSGPTFRLQQLLILCAVVQQSTYHDIVLMFVQVNDMIYYKKRDGRFTFEDFKSVLRFK
jgi:hypothetical protein